MIKRVFISVLLGLIPGLLLAAVLFGILPAIRNQKTVSASAPTASRVRLPAVAGKFYPKEPSELRRQLSRLLSAAGRSTGQEDVVALVTPHAGYDFSGPVAAEAFAQVKGDHFDTVVVIGPSHYTSFEGAAVYDGDYYRTPLGRVPIDKDTVHKLMAGSPTIRPVPQAELPEHSVEVEVPWLQRTVRDFKLVSLIVGDQSRATADSLGRALAAALQGRKALLVASVDLSHYYPYDRAIALDRVTAGAVANRDEQALFQAVADKTTELDGPAVVGAVLIAAKRLGAGGARVLKLANSGDITGDKDKVVGYLAAAIYRPQEPGRLTDGQRRALLKLAREAIAAHLNGRGPPGAVPADKRLRRLGMAFVTITEAGALRGCIGFTEPSQPLYKSVASAAVAAASRDPRFSPLTAAELDKIELEISVLSTPSPVRDINEITIGRHGLILTQGNNRGLFLPRVPVDEGWDTTAYLDNLGLKAGLDRYAWRSGAGLEKFEAEVFAE